MEMMRRRAALPSPPGRRRSRADRSVLSGVEALLAEKKSPNAVRHPFPEVLAGSSSALLPGRFPEEFSRIKKVGNASAALDLRKDFKTKENGVKTSWMNPSASETERQDGSGAYTWVVPGAPWRAPGVYALSPRLTPPGWGGAGSTQPTDSTLTGLSLAGA